MITFIVGELDQKSSGSKSIDLNAAMVNGESWFPQQFHQISFGSLTEHLGAPQQWSWCCEASHYLW
jgi:hypothetical protein